MDYTRESLSPQIAAGDSDQQLLSAFGQGFSKGQRGGYLADNPHRWDSEPWRIWREGFAYGSTFR